VCVVKVIVTRDPCVNISSNSDVHDDDDVVAVEVRKTRLRAHRIYIVVYKTVCYLLFRVGGPLAALVLLNFRLLSTLRRQKRWRRSRQTLMTSQVSAWRRENVTAMLVTVVTVFIICELPDPCLRLVYAAVQLTSDGDPNNDRLLPLRYANTITNALLAFNSSINFVIYFLVGRTFRRVFISSLGCCPDRRHRRQPAASVAAAEEAACVAMTTLRRHDVEVVQDAERLTVRVAKDNDTSGAVAGNYVTSHRCHDNSRKQEHTTVVSVDVEK